MGLTTLWQALLDGPVPWPPARFRGRGRHAPDPPVMRSHRGPARSVRPSHAVRTGFAALLVGACLAPALHAQSSAFSGAVALSSQLVDRGQAITRTTPILQGAASWTFPAGWSLGLSASTEVRSPGHVVAALAQASRHWSLAGDWQLQAGLLYYRYPGMGRSRGFDRAEATEEAIIAASAKGHEHQGKLAS